MNEGINDLSLFGSDPFWLVLIKVLGLFVLMMTLTILNVWIERRILGRMQQRKGPTFNGPFGLLQALADGMKLMFKEDFAPKNVDKFIYSLAPFVMAVAALSTFAVIPLGGEVTMFGHQTRLQLVDSPVAVLLMLALTSIGIYGVVLGGWAANSTYSLLGGLRSSAQLISYEIAMGLALVSVFIYAGSMSTSQIVERQDQVQYVDLGPLSIPLPSWYAVVLIPSFVIYVIAIFGETNRQPFDMPESEGELGSGYMTEYSGFRYALYFLAEYINMLLVSCLAATLFLGGYKAPFPFNLIPFVGENPWFGPLWLFMKAYLFMFLFMWVRASLPRVRYDQLMHLGWKILIPVGVVWTMLVATFRVGSAEGWLTSPTFLVIAGVLVVAVIVLGFLPTREPEPEPEPEFDAWAGGYPVPPPPGVTLPELSQVVRSDSTIEGEADEEPASINEGAES
ncbi:MAG: NADH-quinone oxidoreductase subunit NuoH [Propionibacterium sp.]|nr:NADH-quinone oxidoreductase subunit NuoH [Propionibacterium sp.]